jgi:hypothetical protein
VKSEAGTGVTTTTLMSVVVDVPVFAVSVFAVSDVAAALDVVVVVTGGGVVAGAAGVVDGVVVAGSAGVVDVVVVAAGGGGAGGDADEELETASCAGTTDATASADDVCLDG